MLIGVPLETLAGETRVAVTPETVKKLKAQGHTLKVQSGAGVAASVPDAVAHAWTTALQEAQAAPGYAALCARHGLYPFALSGAALDDYVQRSLADYRRLAQDLGLRSWPR